MNTQRKNFRVTDVLALVLCYLWYNPAVHLAVIRVFW